jgi:hypothetical protein
VTCIMRITPAGNKALTWLISRGGDGVFVKGGATIMAQGEIAPVERKTWIMLRDARRIEFYSDNKRVRVIDETLTDHTKPPRPLKRQYAVQDVTAGASRGGIVNSHSGAE